MVLWISQSVPQHRSSRLLEALLLASLDGLCLCERITVLELNQLQLVTSSPSHLMRYSFFTWDLSSSQKENLLGMRCFNQDLEMDTAVGERDQLLLSGRSSILWVTAHGGGERKHEPPLSLLTLIRFARLMSSAVMVLCAGAVLSSCWGWICSGWLSDCCSSVGCVSDGTGVCSCCSSPFSVACLASSNCPLLEKCSKSWNRKPYSQWLFPPPTEKCFDITQQTTRFLHISL